MKKATVGLTGGIGSGKSTIAKMFNTVGIPVYIADIEAKQLMVNDEKLRQEIKKLLGNEAYLDNGVLNRVYIADKVFKDATLLQKLNAIVHPAVGAHFERWKTTQNVPYVIKEAAILFENDSYQYCDYTILVTAPIPERIKRVIARDQITKDQIEERMQHQWTDEKKIPLADFVIENITLENTKEQVEEIHMQIKALLA